LDAYRTTGCINHICPGFIQTSKKVALGADVQPLSQRGGQQYQMSIRIDHVIKLSISSDIIFFFFFKKKGDI
jgi:hypothetical protein